MAKKRNLKDIDEFDKEVIEEKMNGVKYLNEYKTQLKTLSYKLNLKCQTQSQKDFTAL